jgi:hypothetical protein
MMPIKADKKRMPKPSERRRRRSLLSCWFTFLGHIRILRIRSNSLLLANFVFSENGEMRGIFSPFNT